MRVGGRRRGPGRRARGDPAGALGLPARALEPPAVVLTVRVIDRAAESVDDQEHRLTLDDAGRIARLEA